MTSDIGEVASRAAAMLAHDDSGGRPKAPLAVRHQDGRASPARPSETTGRFNES